MALKRIWTTVAVFCCGESVSYIFFLIKRFINFFIKRFHRNRKWPPWTKSSSGLLKHTPMNPKKGDPWIRQKLGRPSAYYGAWSSFGCQIWRIESKILKVKKLEQVRDFLACPHLPQFFKLSCLGLTSLVLRMDFIQRECCQNKWHVITFNAFITLRCTWKQQQLQSSAGNSCCVKAHLLNWFSSSLTKSVFM